MGMDNITYHKDNSPDKTSNDTERLNNGPVSMFTLVFLASKAPWVFVHGLDCSTHA